MRQALIALLVTAVLAGCSPKPSTTPADVNNPPPKPKAGGGGGVPPPPPPPK